MNAQTDQQSIVTPNESTTNKKTMLMLIFTCNGKFNVEAVPHGTNVDAEKYIEFLRITGEKWRVLRTDPTKLSELTIQYDNARPHTSSKVKDFIAARKINTIWQSPYSPDLNLCDRWLFDRLKRELEGSEFTSHEEVQSTSLQVLRSIPQSEMAHELDKLFQHCQAVIDCGGDYVV